MSERARGRLADKKREREKHLQGAFSLPVEEVRVAPLTTKKLSKQEDTMPLRIKTNSMEIIDDLFYRRRMNNEIKFKYEAVAEIIAKYQRYEEIIDQFERYEELVRICGSELKLQQLVENYANESK